MVAFKNIDFVGRWRICYHSRRVPPDLCGPSLSGDSTPHRLHGRSAFTASGVQGSPSTAEVREALPGDLGDRSIVQSVGDDGYEVRTPVLSEEGYTDAEVRQALEEELGAEVSVTSISPTFGGQIRTQALQAVAAALAIIVLFIIIRFSLLRDGCYGRAHPRMLITIGIYALWPEVNLVTGSRS